MKYIFFYSPIYEYYHYHITESLSKYFDIEPILIQDLKTKKGHIFNGGVSLKIELIISKIKENYNQYILFTDATLLFNQSRCDTFKNYIQQYHPHDLCFADNNIDNTYNIGFISINCNDKTLKFFEDVLEKLVKEKSSDQLVVNTLLNNTNLIVKKFNKQIYCNYYFDNTYKDSFYIFKCFIKHTKNKKYNYNQRIEQFYKAKLITAEQFNLLIKK